MHGVAGRSGSGSRRSCADNCARGQTRGIAACLPARPRQARASTCSTEAQTAGFQNAPAAATKDQARGGNSTDDACAPHHHAASHAPDGSTPFGTRHPSRDTRNHAGPARTRTSCGSPQHSTSPTNSTTACCQTGDSASPDTRDTAATGAGTGAANANRQSRTSQTAVARSPGSTKACPAAGNPQGSNPDSCTNDSGCGPFSGCDHTCGTGTTKASKRRQLAVGPFDQAEDGIWPQG